MFNNFITGTAAKNAIDRVADKNIQRGRLTVCRIAIAIGRRVELVKIQKAPFRQFCAYAVLDRRLIIAWDFKASEAFRQVAEKIDQRLKEARQ